MSPSRSHNRRRNSDSSSKHDMPVPAVSGTEYDYEYEYASTSSPSSHRPKQSTSRAPSRSQVKTESRGIVTVSRDSAITKSGASKSAHKTKARRHKPKSEGSYTSSTVPSVESGCTWSLDNRPVVVVDSKNGVPFAYPGADTVPPHCACVPRDPVAPECHVIGGVTDGSVSHIANASAAVPGTVCTERCGRVDLTGRGQDTKFGRTVPLFTGPLDVTAHSNPAVDGRCFINCVPRFMSQNHVVIPGSQQWADYQLWLAGQNDGNLLKVAEFKPSRRTSHIPSDVSMESVLTSVSAFAEDDEGKRVPTRYRTWTRKPKRKDPKSVPVPGVDGRDQTSSSVTSESVLQDQASRGVPSVHPPSSHVPSVPTSLHGSIHLPSVAGVPSVHGEPSVGLPSVHVPSMHIPSYHAPSVVPSVHGVPSVPSVPAVPTLDHILPSHHTPLPSVQSARSIHGTPVPSASLGASVRYPSVSASVGSADRPRSTSVVYHVPAAVPSDASGHMMTSPLAPSGSRETSLNSGFVLPVVHRLETPQYETTTPQYETTHLPQYETTHLPPAYSLPVTPGTSSPFIQSVYPHVEYQQVNKDGMSSPDSSQVYQPPAYVPHSEYFPPRSDVVPPTYPLSSIVVGGEPRNVSASHSVTSGPRKSRTSMSSHRMTNTNASGLQSTHYHHPSTKAKRGFCGGLCAKDAGEAITEEEEYLTSEYMSVTDSDPQWVDKNMVTGSERPPKSITSVHSVSHPASTHHSTRKSRDASRSVASATSNGRYTETGVEVSRSHTQASRKPTRARCRMPCGAGAHREPTITEGTEYYDSYTYVTDTSPSGSGRLVQTNASMSRTSTHAMGSQAPSAMQNPTSMYQQSTRGDEPSARRSETSRSAYSRSQSGHTQSSQAKYTVTGVGSARSSTRKSTKKSGRWKCHVPCARDAMSTVTEEEPQTSQEMEETFTVQSVTVRNSRQPSQFAGSVSKSNYEVVADKERMSILVDARGGSRSQTASRRSGTTAHSKVQTNASRQSSSYHPAVTTTTRTRRVCGLPCGEEVIEQVIEEEPSYYYYNSDVDTASGSRRFVETENDMHMTDSASAHHQSTRKSQHQYTTTARGYEVSQSQEAGYVGGDYRVAKQKHHHTTELFPDFQPRPRVTRYAPEVAYKA